ncbi:MAG: AI-2E family transporter [Burkholderiales bacterium]|nr:AI-2E family transporter [Burkholderiales bacterium]
MEISNVQRKRQRVALGFAVACVITICALVLTPFVTSITWAAILTYIGWPVQRRLRNRLGRHPNLGAALMTLLTTAALLVPLLVFAAEFQHDAGKMIGTLREYIAAGPHALPEVMRSLPGADRLEAWMQAQTFGSKDLEEALSSWVRLRSVELLAIAAGIGRNLFQFAFCVVTLFFMYRDADVLVGQVRGVSRRVLGTDTDRYLKAAAEMVRAVVYGVLLTAIAQGIVAGFGLWIVGVGPFVLLGALTALATLLPLFGTFVVLGPVAAGLFLDGRPWAALLLTFWGLVLVHPIDNLLRPLVVSSVTRMPFLIAMFGVLGGVIAFGLVGVFVGPIALAVGLALWNELATADGGDPASSG